MRAKENALNIIFLSGYEEGLFRCRRFESFIF